MKNAATAVLILLAGIGQIAQAEEGAYTDSSALKNYIMEMPANSLKVAKLNERLQEQLSAINEQLEQLITDRLILSIQ